MANKGKNQTITVSIPGVKTSDRITSVDAEMKLIGAILIDPKYADEMISSLTAYDFSTVNTRLVFNTVFHLVKNGVTPDFLTVKDRMSTEDWAGSELSVADFLLECTNACESPLYAPNYVSLIQDMSLRRKILTACSEIAIAAYNEPEPDKFIGQVEAIVLELTKNTGNRKLAHISDGLYQAYSTIAERKEKPRELIGIPSGLSDLDRITKGWKGGEFIIIGARPGMGKTAIATQFTLNALRSGYHVLSINMEMIAEQSMMRIISSQTGISTDDLALGNVSEEQFEKIGHIVGEMSDLNLWYSNATSQNIYTIASMARRQHRLGKLDMLVVDYLQLIEADNKSDNLYTAVGNISRMLKILSNDLNIPVITLAQLSRSLEQRQDKRPLLSDLRDSGKIEADADMVIFLYRDEYYRPDDSARPNIMEAIVAKNRNGNTGTADLYWRGKTTSVHNLSRQKVNL